MPASDQRCANCQRGRRASLKRKLGGAMFALGVALPVIGFEINSYALGVPAGLLLIAGIAIYTQGLIQKLRLKPHVCA